MSSIDIFKKYYDKDLSNISDDEIINEVRLSWQNQEIDWFIKYINSENINFNDLCSLITDLELDIDDSNIDYLLEACPKLETILDTFETIDIEEEDIIDSKQMFFHDLKSIPKMTKEEFYYNYNLYLKYKRDNNTDRMDYYRDKIIKGYLRLTVFGAIKYYKCDIPTTELISVGTIGLMKALDNFNINKGCSFSSYAMYYINRNIFAYYNKYYRPYNMSLLFKKIKYKSNELEIKSGHTPRPNDIAGALGIEQEKVVDTLVKSQSPILVEDPTLLDIMLYNSSSPKRFESEVIDKCFIEDLLSNLSNKAEFVIRRRYGIPKTKDDYENSYPHTYRELAKEMNVSVEYVHQLEKKILTVIRDICNNKETKSSYAKKKITNIHDCEGLCLTYIYDIPYDIIIKVKEELKQNQDIPNDIIFNLELVFGVDLNYPFRFSNLGRFNPITFYKYIRYFERIINSYIDSHNFGWDDGKSLQELANIDDEERKEILNSLGKYRKALETGFGSFARDKLNTKKILPYQIHDFKIAYYYFYQGVNKYKKTLINQIKEKYGNKLLVDILNCTYRELLAIIDMIYSKEKELLQSIFGINYMELFKDYLSIDYKYIDKIINKLRDNLLIIRKDTNYELKDINRDKDNSNNNNWNNLTLMDITGLDYNELIKVISKYEDYSNTLFYLRMGFGYDYSEPLDLSSIPSSWNKDFTNSVNSITHPIEPLTLLEILDIDYGSLTDILNHIDPKMKELVTIAFGKDYLDIYHNNIPLKKFNKLITILKQETINYFAHFGLYHDTFTDPIFKELLMLLPIYLREYVDLYLGITNGISLTYLQIAWKLDKPISEVVEHIKEGIMLYRDIINDFQEQSNINYEIVLKRII